MESGGEREINGCTLRWTLPSLDGVLTVAIAGEMDLGNAAEVRATVTDLARRTGVEALCVDLVDLTFIDSSGLSSLVGVKADADSAGLALEIENLSDGTRRTFEITGLTEYLNVEPAARFR